MDANMKSETSLQQSETPIQCANRCGFFGTAATMNLCSKCYRDHQLKQDQTSAVRSAVEKSLKTPMLSVGEGTGCQNLSAENSVVVTTKEGKEEVAGSNTVVRRNSNRCGCCNKKVGVVGFTCRCGVTFCGSHRYPEEHNCEFDHKASGREALAKANPLVAADKLQRI